MGGQDSLRGGHQRRDRALRPAPETGSANLKREYYAEYRKVEDVHWWFVGRRRILLQLLDEYVGPNGFHDRRILDVGCGTGTMLSHLAAYGKAEGVDIDAEAVGYCLERGLKDVRIGEAAKLPFEDGSFDLVTCLDVVEHLDDDLGALREMKRVLRPGGHLLVTVPASPFLWGDQDEINLHKRRYVADQLRERLLTAGFKVIRLSYMNALLFPPIAAVRMLRRLQRRFRPRMPVQSDFHYPSPGPVNFALGHLFSVEGPILRRADIPFGVSLVAIAKKDATS